MKGFAAKSFNFYMNTCHVTTGIGMLGGIIIYNYYDKESTMDSMMVSTGGGALVGGVVGMVYPVAPIVIGTVLLREYNKKT